MWRENHYQFMAHSSAIRQIHPDLCIEQKRTKDAFILFYLFFCQEHIQHAACMKNKLHIAGTTRLKYNTNSRPRNKRRRIKCLQRSRRFYDFLFCNATSFSTLLPTLSQSATAIATVLTKTSTISKPQRIIFMNPESAHLGVR